MEEGTGMTAEKLNGFDLGGGEAGKEGALPPTSAP